MKNVKFEILYALFSILFFSAAFFSKDSLNIVDHDTYYVMSNNFLFTTLALIFLFFVVINWLFRFINKPLNQRLNLLHFSTTTIVIILGAFIIHFSSSNNAERIYENYSVYGEFDSKTYSAFDFNYVLAIIFLFGILVQLFFLINVFIAIFKRK
jgi:hypothetical protein